MSDLIPKLDSAYAPEGIGWPQLMEAARRYAALGFTVVPTCAKKAPVGGFVHLDPDNCLWNLQQKQVRYNELYLTYRDLVAKGEERTPEEDKELKAKVEQLSRYPIVGIGLRTGRVHFQRSSFIVIDLDVKPSIDGVRNFHDLCARLGVQLPLTVQAQSGSGPGRHFYFAYEQRFTQLKQSVNIEGLGIDLRLNNCQVVVDPSPWFRHNADDDTYKFERFYRFLPGCALGECPIAPLPDALFSWFLEQDKLRVLKRTADKAQKQATKRQKATGNRLLTDMWTKKQ